MTKDDGRGSPEGAAALVSVVIPCYNQAHFLGEAIESVLAQSHLRFEILVVDDGSTDDTCEVAARYPGVQYVRQDNRGLAEARNAGLRQSTGSYLVFLDADDRLLPEALGAGLERLAAHPECAFVFGQHSLIAADGSPLPPPRHPYAEKKNRYPFVEKEPYLALLRFGNFVSMHATVMYRRSVLDSAGGFDASVEACEDYELYLRIARQYPMICCHGKVIAQYRQHGTQMSRDAAFMLDTSLAMLRSQRKYVKGSKQREEAYKAGTRFWKSYYGNPLATEILARSRAREWERAMRGMLVLARYPRTLAPVLRRALRKLTPYVPLGKG